MIRIFLIVSLIVFKSAISFAQGKRTDSLKIVLKNAKHDTTRCTILAQLCHAEPDELLKNSGELKTVAEKNLSKLSSNDPLRKNYQNFLGISYNYFGNYYAMQGKFEKALECFNICLKIGEELNDKPTISAANNSIGEMYRAAGDLDKALQYLELSMKQNEALNERMGVASALNTMGSIYSDLGKKEKAIEYIIKSAKIIESLGDLQNTAYIFINIGSMYSDYGNIQKALEYYEKSLPILVKIDDKKGMAAAYNNIASACERKGMISKAIENYNKSLKIYEKSGDRKGIAITTNNIGTVYISQGDTTHGIEYYYKTLKIFEENKDKINTGLLLANIGHIYVARKNYKEALDLYTRALKTAEEIGHKLGIAKGLNNTASVYKRTGDTARAMENYTKALKIAEEIENKETICLSLIRISYIYFDKNKLAEAKTYASRSLELARKLGFPEQIQDAAKLLFKIAKKQNNYKDAFEMHELYVSMRDSTLNKETRKASIRSQIKYDYEKQAAKDSIKSEEKFLREKIVHEQEITQQRNLKYAGFIGGAFMLIIAIGSFKAFKNKQKANLIIVKQKELVEAQHKEITDSINYAQRIQTSLLAPKKLLDEGIKPYGDYFIFFQPKDVVSGDFYWATKLHNGNFALVTADSTGHGVPGAIMSMLNIACLNEATEAKKYTEPADILNYTRQRVINHLMNDGSSEGGKDGMDCSIACFDFKNKKFSYAAANNPLWIIRAKDNAKEDTDSTAAVTQSYLTKNGYVLMEFKPDKMPVGKHDKENIPFKQQEVQLKPGDIIYTLTDGMADQFGGANGKKFMYKQLKELLLTIGNLPMPEQEQKLTEAFKSWKGNLEQVDDICVIGIKV